MSTEYNLTVPPEEIALLQDFIDRMNAQLYRAFHMPREMLQPAERICLSCGARINAAGVLPCGH